MAEPYEVSSATKLMQRKVPRLSKWRHLKTGATYVVIANDAVIEASLTPAIAYCPLGPAGPMWVRPLAEFLDGRFERIS